MSITIYAHCWSDTEVIDERAGEHALKFLTDNGAVEVTLFIHNPEVADKMIGRLNKIIDALVAEEERNSNG